MLSALYDGERYFDATMPLSCVAVSARLHLGTKYQIDALKRQAVSRLRAAYPETLRGFNALLASDMHKPGYGLQISSAHAIAVISLAWKFELFTLLPSAFYLCAQLSPERLTEGLVDGADPLLKLSPKDLERCLRGQIELRWWCLHQKNFILQAGLSDECDEPHECSDRMEAARVIFTHNIRRDDASALGDSFWIAAMELCKRCTEQFSLSHSTERSEVWPGLATMFDLSDVVPWPMQQDS